MQQQSGVSVCTNNGPSDPLHLDGRQADQCYNLVMMRSTHLGVGSDEVYIWVWDGVREGWWESWPKTVPESILKLKSRNIIRGQLHEVLQWSIIRISLKITNLKSPMDNKLTMIISLCIYPTFLQILFACSAGLHVNHQWKIYSFAMIWAILCLLIRLTSYIHTHKFSQLA